MKNIARIAGSLKNTISTVTFPPKNRYQRQIPRIYYSVNKKYTPGQYAKVKLDLNSDNEQDMTYDYYDSGNYYNYQVKNTNGLINDCNLSSEIESNSKPVTKTLSESQERKRCIQKKLGSRKHQQEELFSESIEDEKISELKCRDCKLLKQNTNLEEPKNSSNSRLKKINDEYFINILKQLIDKLDKPKRSKSLSRKDLLIQKSNELVSFENKSAEKPNNSSSEELVLTLEKIKGNRMMDKLDSSPENIFINGKWVRNKIKENNNYDSKPVANLIRSELGDRNESIPRGDMNSFDLINPKTQITVTNQDISDNLNNLKVTSIQENKEVSTSPTPEEKEHFLVTRETPNPLYLSSTLKNKLDSTIIDDNDKWKFKTADFMDIIDKKNDIPKKMYDKNQDKSIKSTLGNFQTTSNMESSEDSTFDINNNIKTKNFDDIFESSVDENDSNSKNNNSMETDSVSVEEENNSLEKKLDCSCNKKIFRNILSSTIMKNITEIRTDTSSPDNFRVKSQNRSKKSRKTNGENIKENNTSESTLIKSKNYLNLDLLEKKQIPYVSKNIVNVPKVEKLQKSGLAFHDNNLQNNKVWKVKTNLQNVLSENKSSYLKSQDQNKKINNEGAYNSDETKNKRIPLIPKNLSQKYPRQFVTQLKQDISRKPHTYTENSFGKFNNNNKTATNRKISTSNRAFKGSDRTQNKIVSKILPQSIPKKLKEHENIDENHTKMPLKTVVTKLKYDVPMNSKSHTGNYDGYNGDAVTMDKKISPITLSPVTMKSINMPLSKTMTKQSKIVLGHSDVDVTKNNPRKFVIESNAGKTVKENINNMKKVVASRNNPLGLDKNIDNTKIHTRPKNTLGNTANGPTDRKRINFNKPTLKANKTNTSLLVPKPSTPLGTTPPKQNNDAISKYKFKNPINDRRISNEKIPIEKYDFLVKPDLALRNKNTFNDEETTKSVFIKKNGSSPNSQKLNYETNWDAIPQAKLPKVTQTENDYDYEHSPYKSDDLKPIIFNEPTEKPKLSNRNSKLFLQHASRQPSLGYQFQSTPDPHPLQSVPIIRPEYDDYPDTGKNNNGEVTKYIEKPQYVPELNVSSYGSIEDDTNILDSIKFDVNDLDGTFLNQSKFEILPQLNVDSGVFKIPLLGRTTFDDNKNGSEYISDILIPIEKSNGQYAAISLTQLLTGDFHLLNGDDKHSLAVDLTSDMNSPLSASQTSNDGAKSDKTGKPCDPITLKTFHTNGEGEKQMVPVHIVLQIINNGMCSNNGTKTEKKQERNNNLQKFRNESKRVSYIRPQNVPNNPRKINQKLENAYSHFDSEILDRFLQVYTPNTV